MSDLQRDMNNADGVGSGTKYRFNCVDKLHGKERKNGGVRTALTPQKPKCNRGIMKQVLHFENLDSSLLPNAGR